MTPNPRHGHPCQTSAHGRRNAVA